MQKSALAALLLALLAAGAQADDAWLHPTPRQLPRWRGFNLTDMFSLRGRNGPFQEEDFKLIGELGFNFVRLPLDYRTWIVDGDWEQFDEEALQRIDQAVAYGEQYQIHVMINFHRAPGYTVARPPEAKSLWTDPKAQRVCALHWATFAKRYRGIPNERLSFNLFNEPNGVEPAKYAEVVKPIVVAIRREDPDRLIVSDGIPTGRLPVLELLPLGLAQATRGYVPGQLTHYRASWVSGSEQLPVPTWPTLVASGTLAAPTKQELSEAARQPLRLEGPFETEAKLRLHVMNVSKQARLQVKADGAVVWEHDFVCGPGEGEWKQAHFMERWNAYQNLYDKDYEATIPAGTKLVEVGVAEGDWLQILELGLTRPGQPEDALRLTLPWNQQPAQMQYRPGAADGPFLGGQRQDRQWLWDSYIVPWQEAQTKGIGVMVGEFGCFNKTPHDVALRWMEDCLRNWQQAGWGWAMWNFRGSFGILDSGREDVEYEDWHGHKLDREMLELLLKYR